MHQPGIEPGSVPWQGTILPLDHWCFVAYHSLYYMKLLKLTSLVVPGLTGMPETFIRDPDSIRDSIRIRSDPKIWISGRAESGSGYLNFLVRISGS
uniref:Uncharacterized protein n=1 Tax=Brassica oleracea var. oleracea TaxID=109376 RepID=A0A0D2ZUK9_BRAOL